MQTNKIAIVFAASILSLQCYFSHSEVIDKILVVVNGEAITQNEITRKAIPFFEQYKTRCSEEELEEKMNGIYKNLLERTIDDKLLISEARRKNIEVPEKEIEEEFEKVKKRFNSEEEFYYSLEMQGLSPSALKKTHKEALMARKLIDEEIGSKITIRPNEVLGYYREHKEDFRSPDTVRVQSILIRTDQDGDSENALKKAREALSRLKDNESFEAIAKEYSEGALGPGETELIKKGEMIEAIDREIFSLKEGEFSGIIKTGLGFHIFKVEDIMPSELKKFEDARKYIERSLFNEKIQEKLTGYIARLRKEAYIAYK